MKLFIIRSAFILVSFISTSICAQDNGYQEIQLTHNNSDNRYASYNQEGELIVFESNRDGNWQIYTWMLMATTNNVLSIALQTTDDQLGILIKTSYYLNLIEVE